MERKRASSGRGFLRSLFGLSDGGSPQPTDPLGSNEMQDGALVELREKLDALEQALEDELGPGFLTKVKSKLPETHELRLPAMGDSVAEATIKRWLIAEGDRVEAAQSVVELETEKVVMELPAPRSGQVLRLHVAVGNTVPVGRYF